MRCWLASLFLALLPPLAGADLYRGDLTVQPLRVIRGDTEACQVFRGDGAAAVWHRAGLWETQALSPSLAGFSRTVGDRWLDWRAVSFTWPLQRVIPSAWIQDPGTGVQYSITRLRIRESSGITRFDLYVTRQITGPGSGTYPPNARLLASIEQGVWRLSFGEVRILLPGPGHASNTASDVNDGLYEWTPSTAVQAELATLLTTLLSDMAETHDVMLSIPHPGDEHARIDSWGASAGSGSRAVLTINESALPVTPTLNATLRHTTSYAIHEGGSTTAIASGQEPGPYTSVTFALPALTTLNRPGSAGEAYSIEARNSALAVCGTRHATARIRTVRAPTITALTASAPSSSQGPFSLIVCSSVDWTATAGDPAATWSWSQTGYHVAHLPSPRNSAPGRGPQRVCIPEAPGQGTTLTLTGTNEAGSASRSVTIAWPGTP